MNDKIKESSAIQTHINILQGIINRMANKILKSNAFNADTLIRSMILESSRSFSISKNYDIFLPHNYLDKKIILYFENAINEVESNSNIYLNKNEYINMANMNIERIKRLNEIKQ